MPKQPRAELHYPFPEQYRKEQILLKIVELLEQEDDEYCQELKDEAGRLYIRLQMQHGPEVAEYYHKVTRYLLEDFRDGDLTEEERGQVLHAVRVMSEQSEPRTNSDNSRRTYALTLKYLAPERLSNREIAELCHVDLTTMFRDLKAATKRLAFWLFGGCTIRWK